MVRSSSLGLHDVDYLKETLSPSVFPQGIHGPLGANIFVFHVPDEWTDDQLFTYFKPFGRITSGGIQAEKNTGRLMGFAIVSFEHPLHAARAIRHMDSARFSNKRLAVQPKNREDVHLKNALNMERNAPVNRETLEQMKFPIDPYTENPILPSGSPIPAHIAAMIKANLIGNTNNNNNNISHSSSTPTTTPAANTTQSQSGNPNNSNNSLPTPLVHSNSNTHSYGGDGFFNHEFTRSNTSNNNDALPPAYDMTGLGIGSPSEYVNNSNNAVGMNNGLLGSLGAEALHSFPLHYNTNNKQQHNKNSSISLAPEPLHFHNHTRKLSNAAASSANGHQSNFRSVEGVLGGVPSVPLYAAPNSYSQNHASIPAPPFSQEQQHNNSQGAQTPHNRIGNNIQQQHNIVQYQGGNNAPQPLSSSFNHTPPGSFLFDSSSPPPPQHLFLHNGGGGGINNPQLVVQTQSLHQPHTTSNTMYQAHVNSGSLQSTYHHQKPFVVNASFSHSAPLNIAPPFNLNHASSTISNSAINQQQVNHDDPLHNNSLNHNGEVTDSSIPLAFVPIRPSASAVDSPVNNNFFASHVSSSSFPPLHNHHQALFSSPTSPADGHLHLSGIGYNNNNNNNNNNNSVQLQNSATCLVSTPLPQLASGTHIPVSGNMDSIVSNGGGVLNNSFGFAAPPSSAYPSTLHPVYVQSVASNPTNGNNLSGRVTSNTENINGANNKSNTCNNKGTASNVNSAANFPLQSTSSNNTPGAVVEQQQQNSENCPHDFFSSAPPPFDAPPATTTAASSNSHHALNTGNSNNNMNSNNSRYPLTPPVPQSTQSSTQIQQQSLSLSSHLGLSQNNIAPNFNNNNNNNNINNNASYYQPFVSGSNHLSNISASNNNIHNNNSFASNTGNNLASFSLQQQQQQTINNRPLYNTNSNNNHFGSLNSASLNHLPPSASGGQPQNKNAQHHQLQPQVLEDNTPLFTDIPFFFSSSQNQDQNNTNHSSASNFINNQNRPGANVATRCAIPPLPTVSSTFNNNTSNSNSNSVSNNAMPSNYDGPQQGGMISIDAFINDAI